MIILNRLVIGGTAMNTLQLVNALKKEYRVILITGSKQHDEAEVQYMQDFTEGAEHIQLVSLTRHIHCIHDINAFYQLKQLIRKYRPVLVQTIGAKPGFLGRMAASQLKVPVIIHAYHGDVFHSYFHPLLSKIFIWLERFAASASDCITTVSKKQKHELESVYKIAPPEKIKHIPIGIETARFHDSNGSLRKSFREKYLLQEHEIAVGIIGRIVPVKNHAFFLQVVKAFESYTGRVKFFIIGDGEQLRRKLELVAKKASIDFTYFPSNPRTAFLTFTSWITPVETAINGMDIIALTSLNEGTPVSLLEAQAAAKPVITSDAGAVAETIEDGQGGYICPQADINEFSKSLSLLINDLSLRIQLGKSGKVFIHTHFELSRQIQSTVALYKSLIEKKTMSF